jgi:hypothetical protein
MLFAPVRAHSRPFATAADLEAAIATVRRMLGTATDDAVLALVNERAAMREELRALSGVDAHECRPPPLSRVGDSVARASAEDLRGAE